MQIIPLYIKFNKNIHVSNTTILLGDVAKIYCYDTTISKNVGNIILKKVPNITNIKYIYSIMYIIDIITKQYPELEIINLGESDFIIEYQEQKNTSLILEYTKVFLISLIVFFGSGFTIMTFNSDVDVANLFDKIYKILLGTKSGHNVLEISYSIGIGLGIILFFNHFSKKKLEKELTPIQIEMRTYENEINDAFLKDREREGKTHDI